MFEYARALTVKMLARRREIKLNAGLASRRGQGLTPPVSRPPKSTRRIPVYCMLLLLDSCFAIIHSCFVVNFWPVCTQLF